LRDRWSSGGPAEEKEYPSPIGLPRVNEAFLPVVDVTGIRWQDRAHFFAISAQTSRPPREMPPVAPASVPPPLGRLPVGLRPYRVATSRFVPAQVLPSTPPFPPLVLRCSTPACTAGSCRSDRFSVGSSQKRQPHQKGSPRVWSLAESDARWKAERRSPAEPSCPWCLAPPPCSLKCLGPKSSASFGIQAK
jgi:hypothetical protein